MDLLNYPSPKTAIQSALLSMLRITQSVLVCCTCFLASAQSTEDSAETSEIQPPIKDHTLFVGLKCRVSQDGEFHLIRDVVKNNVVLEKENTISSIPIHDLQDLDVRPVTMVAAANMTIEDLRHERAYSVLANPEIEAQRAQQAMAEAAAFRMDVAMVEATGGAGQLINQEVLRQTGDKARVLETYLANLEKAQAAFVTESSDYFVNPTRAISSFQDMETEQDQHDVLLIEFEAWASEPIPDAYAVSLTEYTTPENPQEPAIAMHFSDLPWIGTKPRRFTIRQINFPWGFKVSEVQVHIFSKGQEIASNLSEKAMEVSRDEALLFLQMDHLNARKQQDAAPSLVRELIPPSLILPESMDLSGQSVVLNIRDDGTVVEIPDTLTDGRTIDQGIRSILEKVNFYPALEKGTPVASKIEFFLEHLFQ
jgi:hypothetical protein